LLKLFNYDDIYLKAGAEETVNPKQHQDYVSKVLKIQIEARENFI